MHVDLRPTVLSLLVIAPAAAAQAPAYFDDFTYARVGTSRDGGTTNALLGSNSWLASGRRERYRGWRLGFDDDAHAGSAASYFGGPAGIALVGDGTERHLRLTMQAGFLHDPSRYVRPPLVHTAQTFRPGGTFAARIRFSTLEEGQRMTEAFWIYGTDQYRFCPDEAPDCDVRTPPAGTLRHADEADLEFNNWFLAAPTPHLHASAVRYREEGAADDYGANSIALACRTAGSIEPLCVEAGGRSLFPGRWYVLVFRVDTLRGSLEFDAVEDNRPGRARDADAVHAVRPEGTPAMVRTTRGRAGVLRPEAFEPRFPLAMHLSIHYAGRAPGAPSGACAGATGSVNRTCDPHTLDADWVYHTPELLRTGEVLDEVQYWRARGEGRVNTTGRRPAVVDPPHQSASGSTARLDLLMDGPRSTSAPGRWTVRPASVRAIIYKMDVVVETTCRAGAASCTPRTLRPRSPSFPLAPASGESGMVVRAKLFDPWWGYSHVPSPGSAWREWRVTFGR